MLGEQIWLCFCAQLLHSLRGTDIDNALNSTLAGAGRYTHPEAVARHCSDIHLGDRDCAIPECVPSGKNILWLSVIACEIS